MKIESVIKEMEMVFESFHDCVEHAMDVLENARLIAEKEFSSTNEVVELSSILHDIGIIEAEKRHGSRSGKFQELEGPPIALEILKKHGFDNETIERVCFIVGNHHSPEKIDGLDFQILWEADLIVNMQGMDIINEDTEILKKFIFQNFKTEKGKEIALSKYFPNEK